VQELCEKLREHGIRVRMVILFGSYARGDFTMDSDLDLIIVSDDWSSIKYVDRLSILYKLWDKEIDAHFIPLTTSELKERLEKSITLKDASRYWIIIYEDKNNKLEDSKNTQTFRQSASG